MNCEICGSDTTATGTGMAAREPAPGITAHPGRRQTRCLRCSPNPSTEGRREDGPAEPVQRSATAGADPEGMGKVVAFVKEILRESVTAVPGEPDRQRTRQESRP